MGRHTENEIGLGNLAITDLLRKGIVRVINFGVEP